ncbi:MAG: hypothetical protein O3B65_01470, partial [Chloroflexi bacterium]|nr:hypothetical protein [Chloroflexota bacterium]
MFSRTKIAAALITVFIMSMMAVPAFAQTATPTTEPTATPTPDPTATPTPASPTPDATPTPTPPPASPTPDATPTPTPEPGDVGSKPTPPGQLKRNGLFGDVVGVGDDYIIVSTKFGNVTVDVDSATRIKSARDGAISLG